MKALNVIKKLLPFLKLYPWAAPMIVLLGVASSFVEGLGIGLLIPLLQVIDGQQLITGTSNPLLRFFDQLTSGVSADYKPFAIAALIFLAVFLKVTLVYLYTIQVAKLRFHLIYRLRCRIFDQWLHVGQQFWDTSQGGELYNTLHQEAWNIGLAVNNLLLLMINACMILTFTVLLLLLSWPLTLVAMTVMLMISLLVQQMTKQAGNLGKQRVFASKQLQQVSLETINGIRTIRAFNRQPYTQKRFKRQAQHLRSVQFQVEKLTAAIGPIFEGAVIILLVSLMLSTLWGQVSLPVLVTMIFILYRLQPLLKGFDTNRTLILAANSSIDAVHACLSSHDKPYIRSGSVPYTRLKDAIHLQSVSFSYNSQDSPALQNISLMIRQGETVAFVGPSGAGKSTLINLICRFYDVTQGTIEVDGQSLPSLKLNDWRDRIALVSQHVHIFNTTIAENIAYGRLDATDTEIIDAAKQANAHEFICELPEAYDTTVGDRGIRLSGGQCQRLAIARAILRDPDILILDEATNALDSLSENLIQDALYRLSQNRTVLIIAHRLSTIKHANQIVVLKDGQVEETGTFDTLRQSQGLFAQMYKMQHENQ